MPGPSSILSAELTPWGEPEGLRLWPTPILLQGQGPRDQEDKGLAHQSPRGRSGDRLGAVCSAPKGWGGRRGWGDMKAGIWAESMPCPQGFGSSGVLGGRGPVHREALGRHRERRGGGEEGGLWRLLELPCRQLTSPVRAGRSAQAAQSCCRGPRAMTGHWRLGRRGTVAAAARP